MLDPLNALGLDAFVPGNWEPVYGPQRMMELMRKLDTAVIAYNFHDSDTGERLFKPAITVERDGVRVAFVGLTNNHPPYDMWVTRDGDFLYVRGEVEGYMDSVFELEELAR